MPDPGISIFDTVESIIADVGSNLARIKKPLVFRELVHFGRRFYAGDQAPDQHGLCDASKYPVMITRKSIDSGRPARPIDSDLSRVLHILNVGDDEYIRIRSMTDEVQTQLADVRGRRPFPTDSCEELGRERTHGSE